MGKRMAMACAAAAMFATTCAQAEDGYLESEGDAFISLGHCAGPNTKIAVDLQMTELTFGTLPFGSYGDALEADQYNHPMFELYISHTGDEIPRFSWECSSSEGKRQAMNCDRADLERHVISFDGMTKTYASTNVTSGGSAYTYTFPKSLLGRTSTIPLSVFGRGLKKYACTASDFGGASKMKVYGVKIWESGNLVKTFTPCIKGEIPGFKVTGPNVNTFVTGVDVSKVKYGGDILRVPDDAHIDLENDINSGTYGKSLDIDTGYTVGPATRVELDYALLTGWSSSSKWGVNPCLFAASGMDLWVYGTSDGCYAYSLATAGNQYYDGKRGDVAFMSVATAYGIRRTATMNSNSVVFVTAGYTNAVGTGTAISGNLPYTLKIGARYDNIRFLPIRVYGLKIYENDVLRKNYVPVVTNGVPGLVDTEVGSFVKPKTLVNSTITTNRLAVAGGDFDSHTVASEREAYLEFPATGSGIDTGYSVGRDSCIEADFSLWLAGCSRQELINQDSGTDSSYVAFVTVLAGGQDTIWFKYADETGTDSVIGTVSDRRQFIADRHAGVLTIKSGDATLKTWTMMGSNTRTAGSQTLKIGRLNAAMRLYRFKIYEYVNDVKTLQRDYVPCLTNGVSGLYERYTKTFLPLTGGKVSGKGYSGQSHEFETVLQPTRITVNGTGTLTCFAPSAQYYEWYEDGVKLGETSNSLTLHWEKAKARSYRYIHVYSVRPVYTVFNEPVKGAAAETTVEYLPLGTILTIR